VVGDGVMDSVRSVPESAACNARELDLVRRHNDLLAQTTAVAGRVPCWEPLARGGFGQLVLNGQRVGKAHRGAADAMGAWLRDR